MRINIFKKSFSVFVFFVIANFCKSQSFSAMHDFIKTKTDSLFTKYKLPGILVLVNDGAINEFYTIGFANVETKKVFDINTIFEAGSITKTFTAFIVESVLRDNKINDTSSIISYLPDSLRGNKSLSHISFLSLLNHTSGLPRLPDNFNLTEGDMQPYKFYDETKLFAY
jgi:CubicO group peptidase (beta-lactamase class C family)